MKKKKLVTMLMAAALACTSIAPGFTVAAAGSDAEGTTYYVSSLNGKDSNSGTSEKEAFRTLKKAAETALKPGDRICLERGSVFSNDYLHLYEQAGSEEAPIVIEAYGDEGKAAPLIETNGDGVWYQNYGKSLDNSQHKNYGYVSSSILLYDCEYIEVRDIAMTNKGADIDADYNALDMMNRTGVAAVAQNKGTLDHIYLDGLDIQDVYGNVYDKHMNNGGIYFTVFQPADEAKTGVSRYNDVKIENCRVENVNRWGIAVGYTAYYNQFNGAQISDDAIASYGATNVEIRNNYVKDAGGDSITVMYCDRPVVEYNISDGAARQINDTDYSATSFGKVAAGIWPWKCKNALFQHNEAFDTCQNQDGQAWDADWGDGTLYQYNYSHNNGGGSVMFCGVEAVNSTFRYNISQNDLGGIINPTGNPNAHIYNNVFYIKENIDFIRSGMSGGAMTVENNILYYTGDAKKTEDWYKETSDNKVDYSNNVYYNYASIPAEDTNGVSVEKGTQIFEDPGKAPSMAAKQTHFSEDNAAFSGYKLAENSPAVNAGKIITDQNGYDTVKSDFFGNPADRLSPDAGVHETSTPSDELRLASDTYTIDNENLTISGVKPGTTVEELTEELFYDNDAKLTVKDSDGKTLSKDEAVDKSGSVTLSRDGKEKEYKFVRSSEKELISSVFEVQEKVINVPSTAETPITTDTVCAGLSVSELAEISFWSNGEQISGGNAVDGMEVRITAEDGTYDSYTLHVKNEYNYFADFPGGQQGNVWFAQIRGADGTYRNMATYNSEWKGWSGTEWAFVGMDNGGNPSCIKLCDSLSENGREGGHSLAYCVPVGGVLQISFEERADGSDIILAKENSGGDVTFRITKNGETIWETVMPNDASGVEVPMQEIDAQAGDYIRLEVSNTGTPGQAGVLCTPIISYTKLNQPEEADKSSLEELIAYAQEQMKQDSYEHVDPAIKTQFENALAKASEVYENEEATQEEVNAAYAELLEKIELLEYKADASELKTAYDLAVGMDLSIYTEESRKVMEEAIAAAAAVLADKNASQAEIDEALKKLNDAKDQLELIKVDKSVLKKLIEEAEGLDLTKYTEKSAEEVTKALAYAKAVYADENADESEVKAAVNGLRQAMNNLKGKETDEKTTAEIKSDTPETGDNSVFAIWAAILAAACAAGGAAIRFRRKK